MNIKDLDNFQKVSHYPSISLAAKMLGVTQPTLSESIKRLERDLNIKLFYRAKSGIQLTPDGEQALLYIQDILKTKDKLQAIALKESDINLSFTIGCHNIIGSYFLETFLRKIYKSYSNLSINLNHSHSSSVQKDIQDGLVDIGIVVNPIHNPDLIIKNLCEDRIHIWESLKTNRKEDQFFADNNLIQTQSIIRNWTNIPNHQIASTDFHTIGKLAESGAGFAILPERFVLLNKLKLRKYKPKVSYADKFALVYRPEFGKNKVEKTIIKYITDCFK